MNFLNKKQPDRFSRYVDPTGELPNRELKFAEFFVRYKQFLKNILIIILLVWTAGSVGFSLYSFGDYLFFGYSEDISMYQELIDAPNYTGTRERSKPVNLQIRGADTFVSAEGSYDFVARVLNPNFYWLAQLSYTFVYDNGSTGAGEAILLPGEERPVGILGYKSDFFPTNLRFNINDIKWRRIDRHIIEDPREFIDNRLIFSADNVEFVRQGTEGLDSHQLKFDITNESAYSYKDPVFYVGLKGGGILQGYTYVVLDSIRTGEMVSVDTRLLANNLSVSEIELYPAINVFDSSVYISPGQ